MGTLTFFVIVFAVMYVVCPLVRSDRRVGRRSLEDMINNRQVRPAPRYTHGGMNGRMDDNANGRDTRANGGHTACNKHQCHHGVCIPDPTSGYTCNCDNGHTGTLCTDKIPNHHHHETITDIIATPTPVPSTIESTTIQPTTTTVQTTTLPVSTTVKTTTLPASTTVKTPTLPASTTVQTTTLSASTTVKITTETSMNTTTSTATITAPLTQAPTQSTTAQTTQPPVQLHEVSCDKIGTVSQIANQVQASNQLADACASGNHTSPEAFTLKNCPLAMPGFWKQGDNVLKTCSSLPLYTPIAECGTFGYVSSPSSLSGVFLGCDGQPEGFKIAVQKCDSFPYIEHVDVGGSNDPHSFYVIKY